jgi:hypothetical protein
MGALFEAFATSSARRDRASLAKLYAEPFHITAGLQRVDRMNPYAG